ncbi:cysteine proteinase inhibitor 1-like [Cornus florida]|uniref:cysteine proteinase inhibitor 1-like n=1 Tax=Cornus florida TaxID=4283 RepID=UPI00289F18E6|nr:cysteine proteinase inhibitor 1-like [Cornus florida]
MALKSVSLFLSLLLTFLLSDVSAMSGRVAQVDVNHIKDPKSSAGAWQPIKDPKSSLVQEIGAFAVNEHNKQTKTDLKFESVDSGETQAVEGLNYRLILSANNGDASNKYEAVVWDKPWVHFRNLTSFKLI